MRRAPWGRHRGPPQELQIMIGSPDIKKAPNQSGLLRMRPELTLQQLQNILRLSVGLGQYRQTSLLEHSGSGQFGRFRGEIRVLNPGTSRREVLGRGAQVGNGGLEAVLNRTQIGPEAVDIANGVVNGDQGQICASGSADVDIIQGNIVIGCETCDGWQVVESAIPVRV